MTDDENVEQGACPHCGYMNRRTWTLCDNCGAQLPWAPLKRMLRVEDMTDEQLAARYGALPQRKTPYLLTLEGRPAMIALTILVMLVLTLLTRWLF